MNMSRQLADHLALVLAVLWLLAATKHVSAQLIGYGNELYGPMCAEACLRSLKPYLLSCSTPGVIGNFFDVFSGPTLPDCYAKDEAYLTSAAWCFYSKCTPDGVGLMDLEEFWYKAVTGTETVTPKWTYSVALAAVDPKPPALGMTMFDRELNRTSLPLESTYLLNLNALVYLHEEEKFQSRYR